MNRAEKEAEIKLLGEWFSESQIAVCADYRGLTVGQITNLRRELRSSGAFARVVKNTLAKISVERVLQEAEKAEREKFISLLDGPNLLVFSKTDAVTPTKILAKFAKENEKLGLKGGWMDGACLDKQGVETLATLPSREETFAKLLSLMNAPATQLVRLLQEPASQLVRVIDGHRQNLEKGK